MILLSINSLRTSSLLISKRPPKPYVDVFAFLFMATSALTQEFLKSPHRRNPVTAVRSSTAPRAGGFYLAIIDHARSHSPNLIPRPSATMPVTFEVATHGATPINIPKHGSPHKTVEDFLKASCYTQWKASGEMLQTSATESDLQTLTAQKNGFVHTVLQAYGQHHHLRNHRRPSISHCE